MRTVCGSGCGLDVGEHCCTGARRLLKCALRAWARAETVYPAPETLSLFGSLRWMKACVSVPDKTASALAVGEAELVGSASCSQLGGRGATCKLGAAPAVP